MNDPLSESLARRIFWGTFLGALPPMWLPALAFTRFGAAATLGVAAVGAVAALIVAGLVGLPLQSLVERCAADQSRHAGRRALALGLICGVVGGFAAVTLPGLILNTVFPGH